MINISTTMLYKFESPIESLPKVDQLIESLKEKKDITEEIYGNILVSVYEDMNDAFKHGNHCDIDKVVEFNLVDRGATFDFTNNPERAQPNSLKKIAGRGLFVVKSLADMVIREQEGSKVVLNFNLL